MSDYYQPDNCDPTATNHEIFQIFGDPQASDTYLGEMLPSQEVTQVSIQLLREKKITNGFAITERFIC